MDMCSSPILELRNSPRSDWIQIHVTRVKCTMFPELHTYQTGRRDLSGCSSCRWDWVHEPVLMFTRAECTSTRSDFSNLSLSLCLSLPSSTPWKVGGCGVFSFNISRWLYPCVYMFINGPVCVMVLAEFADSQLLTPGEKSGDAAPWNGTLQLPWQLYANEEHVWTRYSRDEKGAEFDDQSNFMQMRMSRRKRQIPEVHFVWLVDFLFFFFFNEWIRIITRERKRAVRDFLSWWKDKQYKYVHAFEKRLCIFLRRSCQRHITQISLK